jgi:hypothetical protein
MHKYIKHILSFFLLLLQLSFANSFGSLSTNKELYVNNIVLSETVKPISGFSETDFKENHIFEHSFLEVVSLPSISFCGGYAELVESWKLLNNVGHDARLNTELLERISKLLPEQQQKVGDLFKNFQTPAGFKGKVDFTATKTIDGKSVSVKYDKNGFPDFTSYSPGKEFVFESTRLQGKGADMTVQFLIKNSF